MNIAKCQYIILLAAAAFLTFSNAEKSAKILRFECFVHEPQTMLNVSCWTNQINRTVNLINLRGDIVQVLNESHLNVQLFKKSELQFKPFIVNFTADGCMFFEKNKGGHFIRVLTKIYLPYTNWKQTCLYSGHVYIKDLPLDWRKIPSLWTEGDYRLDVLVIGNREKLLTMKAFFEIKEKFRRW